MENKKLKNTGILDFTGQKIYEGDTIRFRRNIGIDGCITEFGLGWVRYEAPSYRVFFYNGTSYSFENLLSSSAEIWVCNF